MTEPANTTFDDYGAGRCRAQLAAGGTCGQAAIDKATGLCSWHGKIESGIAAPIGLSPLAKAKEKAT